MNGKTITAFWACVFVAMMGGGLAMAATGETKTYCIGRYLVDVPVEWAPRTMGGGLHVVGAERLGPGDARDAERLTDERIRAIKNGEVIERSWPQALRDVELLGVTRVISRWSDYSILGHEPSEPWTEEIYISSGDILFRLDIAATAESVQWKREQMLKVAKAIHPRAPDEIPPGATTCLGDYYVALPFGSVSESANISFRHPTLENVGLKVLSNVRRIDGRERDFSGYEAAEGTRTTMGGLTGKEQRLWDIGQIRLTAITWQQVSATQPGLEINLDYFDQRYNAHGTPPMTQQDVEALWESVKASIRRKP